MAEFKSSSFKMLPKGHEHKPYKANWLKKKPHVVQHWSQKVHKVANLLVRFGQVFGDCNRDCNSGYDGDCDDDFGSGYLFIFHRFD